MVHLFSLVFLWVPNVKVTLHCSKNKALKRNFFAAHTWNFDDPRRARNFVTVCAPIP